MAKLFNGEIQIVADDTATHQEVQDAIERALKGVKVVEVFVREVNYMGNLEEPLEE